MSSPTPTIPLPYTWPATSLDGCFDRCGGGLFQTATLAETHATVAGDSRWPAFFPAPIAFLTTGRGEHTALERTVGPMIVNRFPLVMAVSLCREELSARHHARRSTMKALEETGTAAVHFLAPGAPLTSTLDAIASEPDAGVLSRLRRSGLPTRESGTTATRVLRDAYLIYEGRLARPNTSLGGTRIYDRPWHDVGSHRVYFLEVVAVHLKAAIAKGDSQVVWQSLPSWAPTEGVEAPPYDAGQLARQRYVKAYTPHYRFPSTGTVAFEADETDGDMSIRHLEPFAADQITVDNERARWPCFFPSSAGLLTAWRDDGRPTAMPCGSSGVVGRLPLTFGVCISNSAINERYAPRATLGTIRARGRFGVGVPFDDADVVRAIGYLGNVSGQVDPDKVEHAGLTALSTGSTPLLAQLPIHFDCRVSEEIGLGTHVMVLGEVERIHVRRDVTPERPIAWSPWARTT
jgi:flavin reductase (DIM6/NTAB) family NADH-FMN oxidoreductase RutF